ncbi:hypothetical protein N7539_003579 [Penicillium diatomitis]|uniref:phospholipase D n=1 Tax=Penicillium diatomitis TaxID=2819901 RepID=A0A9W9XCC7_9EURO|nr:uncharacterized protein N7539_003579 [Penicillium diatomitis]KAJ5488689.1 hypothetical protein N7539_003579 [Penicillium diatomitis]
MSQNNDLAYGKAYGSERGSGDGSRGFGDTFKKLKDTYKSYSQPSGQASGQAGAQNVNAQNQGPYGYSHTPQSQSGQEYQSGSSSNQYTQQDRPQKQDKLSGLLGKLQGTVTDMGSELATKIGTAIDPQAYAQYGSNDQAAQHRFGSFAPPREHNEVKAYVDGCSYFWAVSVALENARESIWILDWWLSPELYLRRPPAQNEKYRLDRMLKDAAVRGVRVNVIVYKEVTQALTLSSSHTKHALEDLHPNIAVFRHPDHLPDRQELISGITQSLQNFSLTPAGLARMSKDTLTGLYGMNDDVILYWAHHEKLCLIDGQIAFMGGLDLCFGRWDTHQHAISDVHPSNIAETVFPGQDYNNSRVLDFENVTDWEKNQLDRMTMSRMGWSDISVGLRGPVVEDLRRHFVERWNYIYDAKYQVRQNTRYARLALHGRLGSSQGNPVGGAQQQGPQLPGVPGQPQFQSQTQQASVPQWQSQQSSAGSQQQHSFTPQWQASQSTSTPSYPPPPGQYTPGPTQQAQHNTSSTYQASQSASTPGYQTQGYQASQGQAPPNPQQSASHGPQQYSYTGGSFPPPPPGPPPSQSPATPSYQHQHQPQHSQNQAPYFPPPPGQGSSSPAYSNQQENQASYYPPPPGQGSSTAGQVNPTVGTRGAGDHYQSEDQSRGFAPKRLRQDITQYGNQLRGQLAGQIHQYQDKLTTYGRPDQQGRGNMSCQIVRSCAKWSNGTPVEHSIADAYAAIIRNSEHFVYIENQFFITATSDSQRPVKNKIGAAIVERILRAARAGKKYKIIVVIPSVPCFAGDLRDEETLGTRAIMEFQYNSINRGGHSIMEMIAKEGYNPMEYIRFYNLRNYDRINNAGLLSAVERESGVHYEDARRQFDQQTVGSAGSVPYNGSGYGAGAGTGAGAGAGGATRSAFDTSAPFQQYQQAAQHHNAGGRPAGSSQWDSVSSCYMLNGPDIRNVPWDGHPDAEIDAFVSEELYVHSKVMIADDRVVICGSANLNDRSQLGDHDSEIAVIIEDFTSVPSQMNGQPWMASRFAASLRRELFRKHLGLLAPQDYSRPSASCQPPGSPEHFDLDCPESQVVADPLSDTLQSLWNSRAHTNTEVFRKVFHAVPDDVVRNWATYKEFYEYYFHKADQQAEGKEAFSRPPRFQWGHVVRDDFAPGAEGATQVKELLSQVKGTLVEMPLMFLTEEDIAKEGVTLNDLTEPLYT